MLHGLFVALDLSASEYYDPSYNKRPCIIPDHISPKFPAVRETAQNRCDLEDNVPVIRNNDGCSSKDTGNFNYIILGRQRRAGEVNFPASEDGGDFSSPEIVSVDLSLPAAEIFT